MNLKHTIILIISKHTKNTVFSSVLCVNNFFNSVASFLTWVLPYLQHFSLCVSFISFLWSLSYFFFPFPFFLFLFPFFFSPNAFDQYFEMGKIIPAFLVYIAPAGVHNFIISKQRFSTIGATGCGTCLSDDLIYLKAKLFVPFLQEHLARLSQDSL